MSPASRATSQVRTVRSWLHDATVWGWRIHSFGSGEHLWSISRVTLRGLLTDGPRGLLVRPPLTPVEAFATSWAYTYPDAKTLGRALLAPAGFALLVGAEREDEVKKAIVDGLAAFRLPDGSYRLENEYRYLIARP